MRPQNPSLLLVAALASSLAACAAAPPVAPPTTPASPAAPTPIKGPVVHTLLGDAPGVEFTGDWTSAACGGRQFARNIHFDADGAYSAIDLMSPCPVGTQCLTSGLMAYEGIWSVENDTLELRDMGGTSAPGPHPTSFRADDLGRLVESGCPYTKGLTVPDGYEPSKVTPKSVR
ncbi:MAG: hypothetical protein EXR69_02965 [Myxococcales bacterium]|nr:hypothetical protein [Myxococcales bacterium]